MNVLLRGTTYQIDEGAVIDKVYNETLDSATIRITNQSSKITLEPYDKVVLNSRTGTYYMLVDTYQENMICVNPKIYEYNITLFSEVKLLEGIILPNISITPRKTGLKRSIYAFLQQYLDEYGEKKRENGSFVNKWSFSQELIDRFSNIDAPEMQWSLPTLREVINDLLMVDDCIATMNNGVIGFIDITKEEVDISNDTHINYVQSSQASNDYVSEIQMNMQNVLQTNVDGIDNTVTTVEYIPFTTEASILNDDNLLLKTQFPILNIKKIEMIAVLNTEKYTVPREDVNFIMKKSDITSYVKEYGEYQTLKIAYLNGSVPAGHENEYQNYCVYFNRGSNKIEGWSDAYKNSLLLSKSTLYLLKRKVFSYNDAPIDEDYTSYMNGFFKIEYETTANQTFRASKGVKPTNNRVIVDNQTNAWVDAYTQGNLEYQKANRLGNPQKIINARYEGTLPNHIIGLGDRFEDSIVYKVEYQEYINHIEVNAYACKDYVMQDYFTGVKSKVRTWVNAQNEAFERHDVEKYYCEFSYTRYNEIGTLPFTYSYILTPFTQYTAKPIEYVSLNTTLIDDSSLPEPRTYDYGQYFCLNCISRVIGDSIVLTAGFSDNAVVSKNFLYDRNSITWAGKDPRTGDYSWANFGVSPILSNNLYFTNEANNFEVKKFKLSFAENINALKDHTTMPTQDGEEFDWNFNWDESYGFLALEYLLEFPYSSRSLSNFAIQDMEIVHHKDNKEIPVLSTQIEFCTDTTDIAFSNEFIKRQKAVSLSNNNPSTFKIYVATTMNYKRLELPTNAIYQPNGAVHINANNHLIYCDGVSDIVGKYIYICTSDDKPILAYKCNSGVQSIYLNILKIRDKTGL